MRLSILVYMDMAYQDCDIRMDMGLEAAANTLTICEFSFEFMYK